MTSLVFAPNPYPSPSSRMDEAVRLNVTKFGDGYEQRSVDGINAITRTCNLSWDVLTIDETTAITGFLRGTAGTQPFMFTFPGDTVAYQYVLDVGNGGLSRTAINNTTFSLKATLRQVFDV